MCLTCTLEEVTGLDLTTEEGQEAYRALTHIPWPLVTPMMVEAAAYIAALYAHPAGGTGGPLHVTTDDHNVEDSSLEFCRGHLKVWTPHDDDLDMERVLALSEWILDLLDPMTLAERQVSISIAHGDLKHQRGRIATQFGRI